MVYNVQIWGNNVWNLLHSIIEKINEKLGNKSDKFISILDIFGFEIFLKIY